jgi:hypothetical protein
MQSDVVWMSAISVVNECDSLDSVVASIIKRAEISATVVPLCRRWGYKWWWCLSVGGCVDTVVARESWLLCALGENHFSLGTTLLCLCFIRFSNIRHPRGGRPNLSPSLQALQSLAKACPNKSPPLITTRQTPYPISLSRRDGESVAGARRGRPRGRSRAGDAGPRLTRCVVAATCCEDCHAKVGCNIAM